jgi:hypothetical protein
LENLGEIDKFLDTYYLPKLDQEVTNNLNRAIISNEIQAVKKRLPKMKSLVLDRFTAEF